MKNYEEIFRQAISQLVQKDVPQEHVEGFAFFLNEKKRRRRRVLLLVTTGLAVIITAGVLLMSQRHFESEADVSQGVEEVVVQSNNDNRNTKKFQPPGNESVTNYTARGTGHTTQINQLGDLEHPAATGFSRAGNAYIHESTSDPIPVAMPRKNFGRQESLHTRRISPDGKSENINDVIIQSARPKYEWESIDALRSYLMLTELPVPPIGALPELLHRADWKMGIQGGWMSISVPSSRDKPGVAYDIGVFIERSVARRLALRAEAGFLLHDGGFDYEKQSATTQFGFTRRNQSNVLTAEQLYLFYLGLTGSYGTGRHHYEAGIRVSHPYGMKGDIVRQDFADQQPLSTEILQDVWLNTSGVRSVLFGASAGYRYSVNYNLDISASIRIPLTALHKSDAGTSYQYSSDWYSLAPRIGLTYSLTR